MFSVFVILILLGYVISLAFSPIYFTFIMIIAIIFSMIYISASYYNSHKIAIASVKATNCFVFIVLVFVMIDYAQIYSNETGLSWNCNQLYVCCN